VVSLNRFEARAHDFNDFVIARGNEGCECCANTFLIVGDQYSHGDSCRTFHANAPVNAIAALNAYSAGSGLSIFSLFEIRQETGKHTDQWKIGTDLKNERNTRAIGQCSQEGRADSTQAEGETEE